MTSNPWDAQAYDTTFGFVGRYGDDVLALLELSPGDRILDLGCGTGRHAAMLAAKGAQVTGLDADIDMLATARRDHPDIAFVHADAADFTLDDLGTDTPFDACFSNAALHWMTPQSSVLAHVRGVLRTDALFVAEMGGAGNISGLDSSLRLALADVGLGLEVPHNYFPTIGEQASALEVAGFRVEYVTWFRRPTILAQGSTAADWTRHFRAMVWAQVPPAAQTELAEAVDVHAKELGLYVGGDWLADYCRLRFIAVAV